MYPDATVALQPPSVCIRRLNLSLPRGHVLGICGAVGSGKTSAIMAIAGQMEGGGDRPAVALSELQLLPLLKLSITDVHLFFGRSERNLHEFEVECVTDLPHSADKPKSMIQEKACSILRIGVCTGVLDCETVNAASVDLLY